MEEGEDRVKRLVEASRCMEEGYLQGKALSTACRKGAVCRFPSECELTQKKEFLAGFRVENADGTSQFVLADGETYRKIRELYGKKSSTESRRISRRGEKKGEK